MKKSFLVFLLVFCSLFWISARNNSDGIIQLDTEQLKTFPAPAGAPVSDKNFSVKVKQGNHPWQILSIYSFLKQYEWLGAPTAEPQFAVFESNGDVNVEIEVKEPLNTFRIRPFNINLKAVKKGQKITLKMGNEVRQLCIEINGQKMKPLLLFCNPVDLNPPDPKSLPEGMIYFGPGYHKMEGSGEIRGKSIYFAGGAIVEGHINIANETNIKIGGSGILYNPTIDGKRNASVINIKGCTKVAIDGITCIQRPDAWGVRVIASHDITFSGFKLIAEIRDGLDIINSQKVNMRYSFVMSQDDAICMKGILEGNNQPVEDIVVEHTIAANMGGGNGIEIGYESVTSIYQRITFQDIDIIYCLAKPKSHPDWPEAAISIHPTQMTEYRNEKYMGIMPPVRDVTYQNIRIESCDDRFYFDIFPNRNSPGMGIENILLENITISDSPQRPSRILGRTDHPISNIKFRNLKILGKQIMNPGEGNFEIKNADPVIYER